MPHARLVPPLSFLTHGLPSHTPPCVRPVHNPLHLVRPLINHRRLFSRPTTCPLLCSGAQALTGDAHQPRPRLTPNITMKIHTVGKGIDRWFASSRLVPGRALTVSRLLLATLKFFHAMLSWPQLSSFVLSPIDRYPIARAQFFIRKKANRQIRLSGSSAPWCSFSRSGGSNFVQTASAAVFTVPNSALRSENVGMGDKYIR